MRRFLGLLALCLVPAAASAQTERGQVEPQPPRHLREATPETPSYIAWMIHPRIKGIFINLPIIDTDPNRGVTYGVLPIWVFQGKGSHIEQIHAPSFTYNKDFGFTPTYRYYYYPDIDASFQGRGSVSKYEREGMVQFSDQTFLRRDVDFGARGQYNVDAGKRFFGIGPATAKDAETNYIEDVAQYSVSAGRPIVAGSAWRVHGKNHYAAQRNSNGPLRGLPRDFDAAFPVQANDLRQQTNEWRLTVDYDTRDHPVTSSAGTFFETFAEKSIRGLASQYDYERYGFDARRFLRAAEESRWVTAARWRYEQLMNRAPFWLMPDLGGKYLLRGYGEGRFIDRGSTSLSLEERFTFFNATMAGTTTEFELAPFAEIGSVFDNPTKATSRYLKPVFGGAVRAVARPQVVGSIDFGVGQEGLAVFMDINYSF